MIGLQCPRYLWIKVHRPEAIPDVNSATQHRFDEGHLVGEYAKKLFPSGIDVPSEFKENVAKTKEFLSLKKTTLRSWNSSRRPLCKS